MLIPGWGLCVEGDVLMGWCHRLRATGVVDVVNPVTQARNEGRFEEIE